jgi:DNA-binding NtrC family response regulator
MSCVLLAEDEPELRALLADRLRDEGMEVLEAGDGIEGMAQLKAHARVQLLLSDIRMPNMDGVALVEAALKHNPELKVLLMTAYAAQAPSQAALQAREIRTLVKPFDPARMTALVSEMLSRP